jgi:parallel beta-helix repeat protein
MLSLSFCFLLLSIVFLPGIVSLEETHGTAREESGRSMQLTYLFKKPTITRLDIYDSVTMEGVDSHGPPGEPVLPIQSVQVLLPPNSNVQSLRILPGKKIILPGTYIVYPGQEPYPINYTGLIKKTKPNQEIYRSSYPYPEDLYQTVGMQRFRGYQILFLNLFPVHFQPNSGQIFFYESLDVLLDLEYSEKNAPFFYRNCVKDKEQLCSKIENTECITAYDTVITTSNTGLSQTSILSPEDKYSFVIITTEHLKNSTANLTFQDLASLKTSIGLNTTIVTVEDITSNPDYWCTGLWGDGDDEIYNDTQAKIRNFIKDAYMNWQTEYILIGGDDDIVPSRQLYYGEYNQDIFGPSDVYYACLDGTFNSDADNLWGESTDGIDGNDVDLLAEVSIGRACVGNTTEVFHFVNKTIAYMNANDKYHNNVVLAGEKLDDYPTWGGDYLDELINESSHNGYHTSGIPSGVLGYNITTLYDRDWPGYHWPGSEMITKINGGSHIINHLGHSGPNMVMKIWLPGFNNGPPFPHELTNNYYCFIYSQGCGPGAFDNPGGYDCIAEHLTVKSAHGAFAVIMNARTGWYYSHSTDSSSQRFNREFWDAIFRENISALGYALQDGKEDTLYLINYPNMRWDYYQLHLLGDPTLPLSQPWLPDHNFGIRSIDVSDHVKSNSRQPSSVTIFNYGKNHETNVVVSIYIKGTKVGNTTIPIIRSQSEKQVLVEWASPYEAGVYNLTYNVTVSGIIENNSLDNEKIETVKVGVLNADTDELFNTIQQAIDDSDTLGGHCIIIPSGIYDENIILNRNLFLQGEDKATTIVQGETSIDSVLTIRNGTYQKITKLTIQNGRHGVTLSSTKNTTLTDITLQENTHTGILLTSSDNVTISCCCIRNNSIGCHFVGNSTEIAFLDNTVKDNDHGIVLNTMGGGNYFIHNEVANNTQNGIMLNASSNFRFESNTIYNNSKGITVCNRSHQNMFIENDVINNTEGVLIDTHSYHTTLYHNYFENDVNAQDFGYDNYWDKGYYNNGRLCGGNWWSDYRGIDTYSGPNQNAPDPDGFGDTPYILSQGNTEDKYPLMFPYFHNSVFNYNSTKGFSSIQTAIDDADTKNGHTIFAWGSVYYEHLEIDKSITLIGQHTKYTILDGTRRQFDDRPYDDDDHFQQNTRIQKNLNSDELIHIFAPKVTITGFTIKNRGGGGILSHSNNNVISNNIFKNLAYGLCLQDVCAQTIIDNTFLSSGISLKGSILPQWNTHTITNNSLNNNTIFYHKNCSSIQVLQDAGQVLLANCSGFTLQNHTASPSIFSITVGFCTNGTIADNENIKLSLFQSSSNIISNNTLFNSTTGIFLEESSKNIIIKNKILQNEYGISLHVFSTNNTVRNNYLEDNNVGIDIYFYSNNNTIINNTIITKNEILNVDYGIYSGGALYNSIQDNTIGHHLVGIRLGSHLIANSFGNSIVNNAITHNLYGLSLEQEFDSIISENSFIDNNEGIYICSFFGLSFDNIMFHNNFINNTRHAFDEGCNIWDNDYQNGFPVGGGNYWDDYQGVDKYHGPFQNLSGGDGIGDTQYRILPRLQYHYSSFPADIPPHNSTYTNAYGCNSSPPQTPRNKDRYPLMEPWSNHETKK